jgi:hypothetical protein
MNKADKNNNLLLSLLLLDNCILTCSVSNTSVNYEDSTITQIQQNDDDNNNNNNNNNNTYFTIIINSTRNAGLFLS